MIELQLIHVGDGTFKTASRFDLALSRERCEIGERVNAKITKNRSGRQNRWFHAMVFSAWENQSAGRQFTNADRLRKHLLILADHCDVETFPPNAITPAVSRWLRSRYDDIQFTTDNVNIYAKTAKSISYKACDHATMCAIADRVIDIICAEIVPGSTRKDWEPYVSAGMPQSEQQERAGRPAADGRQVVRRDRRRSRQHGNGVPGAVPQAAVADLATAGV